MADGPLDPAEIFQHAIDAGFSQNDAVVMTAIALSESGGDTDAISNDSRGLWQVSQSTYGDFADVSAANGLFDPAVNVRSAYQMWQQRSFEPWADVQHSDPDFATHLLEARAAATELGFEVDVGDLSVVTPPAQDAAVQPVTETQPVPETQTAPEVTETPEATAPAVPPSNTSTAAPHEIDDLDDDGGVPVTEFLAQALSQEGKDYVWGANPSITDDNPDSFDCAELIRWSAQRVGLPDTGYNTYNQVASLRAQGAVEIPVELAEQIPGAVLYKYNYEPQAGVAQPEGYGGHVVISLGNGETIEAKGTAYGVGQFDLKSETFDVAFLLPGVDYQDLGRNLTEAELESLQNLSEPFRAPVEGVGVDSDHDMLPDHFEPRFGTNPDDPDTDGDGITDGYEIMVLGTNALDRDTDGDGMVDDIEIALGRNPLVFDNVDASSTPETTVEDFLDTDWDGLIDSLEIEYGTDINDADSDDDGISDFDEFIESAGN